MAVAMAMAMVIAMAMAMAMALAIALLGLRSYTNNQFQNTYVLSPFAIPPENKQTSSNKNEPLFASVQSNAQWLPRNVWTFAAIKASTTPRFQLRPLLAIIWKFAKPPPDSDETLDMKVCRLKADGGRQRHIASTTSRRQCQNEKTTGDEKKHLATGSLP